MADRTTQPADGVGVNPIYGGVPFLWNGAAPTKNQIGGATATLKGTSGTGPDGANQHFNTGSTDGAMSWSATGPSGAYTIAVGLVFPTTRAAVETVFAIAGKLRVMVRHSGGGVYLHHIHTGVAETAVWVNGGAFDLQMWTYVARYTGTQVIQYLMDGAGNTLGPVTTTIGFGGAGTAVEMGGGVNADGAYAAIVIPSDVGETEALALRANLWRAFEPTGGDTTSPTITSASSFSVAENSTTVATLTANETVTWAKTGGADQARFTLNSSTGALAFAVAPDFEDPQDADTNNVYVVQVTATDTSANASTPQTINVTVTNIADTPGVLSTNGIQLGAWVGSGASLTFAYDVGVSYRAEVYPAGLLLGNVVVTEVARTTGAGGAYPANISSLSLTAGTQYEVVFTNQATGAKTAPYRLTAA